MTGRAIPEWQGKTPDTPVPDRVNEALAIYEPRLLSKIALDEKTGCWNWTGAKKAKGYGHMAVGGRFTGSHRVAFELFVGPIPARHFVCHRCDNPACCNPAHLFVGTVQDNTNDKMAKGRHRYGIQRGAKNGSAKLSIADVELIRSAPARRGVVAALARKFGVRPATVSDIRSGKSWRLG